MGDVIHIKPNEYQETLDDVVSELTNGRRSCVILISAFPGEDNKASVETQCLGELPTVMEIMGMLEVAKMTVYEQTFFDE